MYLQEIGGKDLDHIDLAENNNKWRAVVNTVMKFGELHALYNLLLKVSFNKL
jgi:hypothetical protein